MYSSLCIATENKEGSWSIVTHRNKRYSNSNDNFGYLCYLPANKGVQFFHSSVSRHLCAHVQFFADLCTGVVVAFWASSIAWVRVEKEYRVHKSRELKFWDV